MPKFTNMYGLESQSIVDALINDDYDLKNKPANVFSCTEIIDAPKAKILYRRHVDEITIDVSDNFHVMDGGAIHHVIEKSNKDQSVGRISEERVYINVNSWSVHTLKDDEVLTNAGWYNTNDYFLSFKLDNYEEDQKCLEDYKRTSVYEAISGLKDARVQQLNINGFGFRLLGFEVVKLRACLLLKDWSGAKFVAEEDSARRKGFECKYPPIPYKEFYAPEWNDEECKRYISERVALHIEAAKLKDDEIPECSEDERWYRGTSYAVMKEGAARATRVIHAADYKKDEDARKAAEEALEYYKKKQPKDAKKFIIQDRPGIDNRCNGNKVYCHARFWCHYWKKQYGKDFIEDGGY